MRSVLPSLRARWGHVLRSLALSAFISSAIASSASAASLAGTVLDPEGRAVPNARIIVSTQLGAIAETFSGPSGEYEFPPLADGPYDLHVVADGFQTPVTQVILSGDDRQDVTVRLRITAITESVVVSASQVEVARADAPGSVTVISGAELRARQTESVVDALRQVPGLSVARSGSRGALTSLFPRGGASNYTLVLVDGVRANSFGGGYDFAHLSLANIDRIEIVRGPQSALYGSEAIGAVVQVITKRGGAPKADGVIEGGSQATMRTAVGARASHGLWSWGFGAERVQSDGFNGTPLAGGRVDNDNYVRSLASGTLSYQRPNGLDATLAAGLSRDDRGFPGAWGSDPIGVFSGVDLVARGSNDTRRVGLRVAHPWSAAVRQRLDVSYANLDSDFASSFGGSSSGTRRFDGRVQEDLALGARLGASLGAELVREQGRSTFVTGQFGQAIPIDRQVVGAFGEARLAASARMSVTGGLRVERLVRQAVEPDPAAFSPRPPFPRQAVTSINPKIAATYLLTNPQATDRVTRVRASAGTGIRPPDVFEIAFTDNPGLRPERSRSVEAGVEQVIHGGALVIDAAVFANHYDDLIVTTGRALGTSSRYRTDNISNARARGLELSGRARLRHGFAVGGAYTWLGTELLSVDGLGGTAPNPFTVGDPLIRRPRHQGSIDLSFAAARLAAFAALTSRSRVLDLEPNLGSFGGLFFAPGFAVLDIGASVPLTRRVEVFGRVSNLPNRRYEEILGFPAIGRNGVVGVRVAAGR
jgi:outer membrane cobalamin receptor